MSLIRFTSTTRRSRITKIVLDLPTLSDNYMTGLKVSSLSLSNLMNINSMPNIESIHSKSFCIHLLNGLRQLKDIQYLIFCSVFNLSNLNIVTITYSLIQHIQILEISNRTH